MSKLILFTLFLLGSSYAANCGFFDQKTTCVRDRTCCWKADFEMCVDASLCPNEPSSRGGNNPPGKTSPPGQPTFPTNFPSDFPSFTGDNNMNNDKFFTLSSGASNGIRAFAGLLIVFYLVILVLATLGWLKAQPKMRELLSYEKNERPSTLAEAVSPDCMQKLENSLTAQELSQLRWVGAKAVSPTAKKVGFIVMLCIGPVLGIALCVGAIFMVPKMTAVILMGANLLCTCVSGFSMLFVKGCRFPEEIYGMTDTFCVVISVAPWGSVKTHRFKFRSYEYMMVNPDITQDSNGYYGTIIFADELVQEEVHTAHRGRTSVQKKWKVKKIGFQNIARFNDSQKIFLELHSAARVGMDEFATQRKEDMLPFV